MAVAAFALGGSAAVLLAYYGWLAGGGPTVVRVNRGADVVLTTGHGRFDVVLTRSGDRPVVPIRRVTVPGVELSWGTRAFHGGLWPPRVYRANGSVALPTTVVLAFTSLVGLLGRRMARRLRRVSRPVRCRRCGYDLRTTPARCPECGAAVSRPSRPSGR